MTIPRQKCDLSEKIVEVFRDLFGERSLPLHEPIFSDNEKNYLIACIESTFVSSVGKYVEQFEEMLSDYTGARHVIAVVNGTAALHVSLLLAGVRKGDEVLLPALTFVATGNSIIYCDAVPHFIDSNEHSLGIDIEKLQMFLEESTQQKNGECINSKTGRIIRAIIPMHTFGHSCDLNKLVRISDEYNIALIEDAAESLGSFYNNRHTGTYGLLGAISFNGNKIITTGGGGAILTNDVEIAKKARHITTTAKLPHSWEYRHDEVGYNYRMPNINAALGCAQIERIEEFVSIKRRLYSSYEEAFKNIEEVSVFKEPEFNKSNYWLQTLMLNEGYEEHRDNILEYTNSAGIMTRPVWNLLCELEPYKSYPAMNLDGAKSLASRIINIPSGAGLFRN